MRYHFSFVPYLAILASALIAIVSRAQAADITFAPDVVVSGDPNVDFGFTGVLDRAYALGNSQQVDFSTIIFEPFAANSYGDTTTLDVPSSFATSGSIGPYADLLSHGLSHDATPAAITFRGLQPGAEYEVAVLGSGLRVRSDCCSAGAGYTNLFVYNSTTPDGGVLVHWDGDDTTARIIRGSFIADPSGEQTVDFNGFGVDGLDPLTVSANINAVMLSYAVPEPTSLALILLGIAAATATRRRPISLGL